jgi:microsomal dipeptidase-like Zn-dependent dipeptidase
MIPIFDLHCHPTLKIFLCNQKIYQTHRPAPPGSPFGMDVDLPGMQEADVRLAFCSHYVPEAGFRSLRKSRWLFRLLQLLGVSMTKKFEKKNSSLDAYTKMLESMKKLNDQVATAQDMGIDVVLAKTPAAFETAYAQNKTILVHAMEGSHQLGRGFSTQEYLQRLANLKTEEGLALLTIGHFFQNDICDSGGGIPPGIADAIGYQKPPSSSNGLTEAGKAVLNWCQENGLLVDLVHATEKARQDVYAVLLERQQSGKTVRPVLFTHGGLREIASEHMQNEDDKRYLPDLAELEQIRRFGGVLGLILFNYWITGEEEGIGLDEEPLTPTAIDALVEMRIDGLMRTIDEIGKHFNDFDSIAIGSDMDGFTRLPDEIPHVKYLGRLRQRIAETYTETVARKICYENALRVLRAGWS